MNHSPLALLRLPARPKVLWGALSLLSVALASSCRAPQTDDLKSALDGDAKAAKSSAKSLRNIVIKDWALKGRDEHRRPLWSLTARETHIGEGSELQPKRATLIGAAANLYRDGKLESSFRAARIDFLSTPQGIRMQMSGGVQGQTASLTHADHDGQKLKNGTADKAQSTLNGPIALQAPQLVVSIQSRRLWAPQNVRLTSGIGARAIVLQAKSLRADSSLSVAQLSGGVTAHSDQGDLAAQNATWNWKSGRASARGHIVATHEGTTLRGDHLEADVRGARGLLSGHVQAQSGGAKGGGEGRAQAGAMNFDWAARTISAREGVSVSRAGATLQAARVDCDLKLDSAVAGGATLQKDGATLRADRIEAALSGDRATATGHVWLQRDNLSLRADRVQGFDRLTRAVASGAVVLVRDDLHVEAGRAEARGIGRQSTLSIEASGGVRARNAQGNVRAGRASWGGGQVVGSGGVSLEKDGYVLSGARLTADDRFVRANLSGEVRGRMAGGGTVNAANLQKNGAQISATGGVRARRGALNLSGGRLDTTLDGAHSRLSGGVEARTDDGARLNAPALRYDRALDQISGQGGIRYTDARRGLKAVGRSIVVHRVSDEKKREAVIAGVSGAGRGQSMRGLKLF